MISILTVIGARPQIIKAAAINRLVNTTYKHQIKETILHTGQHYDDELSAFFFDELGISKPHYNLQVGSASHAIQTAEMMTGIEQVIHEVQPDFVLVYGDTNSTVAAALVGSKIHIPVIHIEAGLRSFDKSMPEEVNRITTDHCSTLLFSPTISGIQNLKKEGIETTTNNFTINHPGVFHVGDVMLDNSRFYAQLSGEKSTVLEKLGLQEEKFLLATVHRDNTTDDPTRLLEIVQSFDHLTRLHQFKIVWPMHPRVTNLLTKESYSEIQQLIRQNDQIVVIPPASFFDIIALEKHAALIITDSGGLQKEAYFFHKPCVILRPHTEWVELVESGHAILCDADRDRIILGVDRMMRKKLSEFKPVFGTGNAAEQICDIILNASSKC